MTFNSEYGRKLQQHFEFLLERGFNDLDIVNVFLLYVLIKFPEVIEMFDYDSTVSNGE